MNDKVKILVAEDELLLAMDIKQKIETMGYEVTSLVSTAIEAITKSETDKPEIIIMDVQLSGSLTGIDAAKIIIYKHKIPIIFLTSKDSELELLRQQDFGSFLYIPKPADFDAMQKTIKSCVEMLMLS